MDFYRDVTPTATPSGFYSSLPTSGYDHVFEYSQLETTQPSSTRGVSELNLRWPKVEVTSKIPDSQSKLDLTPLVNPKQGHTTSRHSDRDHRDIAVDPEIGKIAEDRIKILALKYANDSISSELLARLAILNTRMTDRCPRVSADQIGYLERSIGEIKSIEQSRIERARRLGLKI